MCLPLPDPLRSDSRRNISVYCPKESHGQARVRWPSSEPPWLRTWCTNLKIHLDKTQRGTIFLPPSNPSRRTDDWQRVRSGSREVQKAPQAESDSVEGEADEEGLIECIGFRGGREGGGGDASIPLPPLLFRDDRLAGRRGRRLEGSRPTNLRNRRRQGNDFPLLWGRSAKRQKGRQDFEGY